MDSYFIQDFSIGKDLKRLRNKAGYTQEQLAQELNVSRQAISKWESGNSIPESEKLLIISDYFNVSLDYLLKENNNNLQTNIKLQLNNEQKTKKKIGLFICICGVICLLVWGILSIFNPSASEQIGVSSMIQIDGNGIFLILCVGAIIGGAKLLLDSMK